MYWDTSGARHFRESCGEERRGQCWGKGGRRFLPRSKEQLGMGWTWLLTSTQNIYPAFFATNLKLPFQSLLQAGGK